MYFFSFHHFLSITKYSFFVFDLNYIFNGIYKAIPSQPKIKQVPPIGVNLLNDRSPVKA